ncbi:MAG: transporter [Elusimicrobiales bacterium]|nr:transporter [Elusimicrobiales bacterium]
MRILLSLVILSLLGGSARAFQPLLGEQASFLGREGRLIVAGMEYSVSKEGSDRYSTGAFAELSYGLWDRLDVLVTVPWLGWSSRGIAESGLGDVLVEAKLAAGERAGWTLALKPGFSLPAGNEAGSLGAGKGGVWLYGLAGREAGPWRFCLNGGYMLNRNSLGERENLLKGSASASRAVFSGLRASAALFALTSKDKNSRSHPLAAVLGLTWTPRPVLDLDAGARLGLNRGAEDFGLLAGLTLRI